MKTVNAKYIRHFYNLEPTGHKYLQYTLQLLLNGKYGLPEKIRIEQSRDFHNGTGFTEFLRIIDKKLIKDCNIKTGLRPIKKEGCFYGDLVQTNIRGEIVQSLILVQFAYDRQKMVVDYFKGFKPFSQLIRNEVIEQHQFNFNEIGKGQTKKGA